MVEGGQGRTQAELEHSAVVVAWCLVACVVVVVVAIVWRVL